MPNIETIIKPCRHVFSDSMGPLKQCAICGENNPIANEPLPVWIDERPIPRHPWIYMEDGEVNKYHIMEGGRWVLSLLHTGEPPAKIQRENMDRIVACVNTLASVPDESLNDVAGLLKLGGWYEYLTYMRKLEAQRDALKSAMEQVESTLVGETSSDKQTHAYAIAEGALERIFIEAVARFPETMEKLQDDEPS